jgi:hypothetical protein
MPDVIANEENCEHVLSARPFFPDTIAQTSARVVMERPGGMRGPNFWS